MKELTKTIFISDLHLDERTPVITQQFCQLLQACDASTDALYILGDLFEAWVGDDDDSPFNRTIMNALKAATNKGLSINFMHGNRDFLIGKKFLRETGCKLLAEETRIDLYGTPVLLMHGDTLCTRDVGYLKTRKLVRNRWLQTIFLLLPLAIRKKYADKMRTASLRHTQSLQPEIMDVTQAEVENVLQQHHATVLIHGHTHRPNIHSFMLAQTPALRIVLPAWHDGGSILCWDKAGNKVFKSLVTD